MTLRYIATNYNKNKILKLKRLFLTYSKRHHEYTNETEYNFVNSLLMISSTFAMPCVINELQFKFQIFKQISQF